MKKINLLGCISLVSVFTLSCSDENTSIPKPSITNPQINVDPYNKKVKFVFDFADNRSDDDKNDGALTYDQCEFYFMNKNKYRANFVMTPFRSPFDPSASPSEIWHLIRLSSTNKRVVVESTKAIRKLDISWLFTPKTNRLIKLQYEASIIVDNKCISRRIYTYIHDGTKTLMHSNHSDTNDDGIVKKVELDLYNLDLGKY